MQRNRYCISIRRQFLIAFILLLLSGVTLTFMPKALANGAIEQSLDLTRIKSPSIDSQKIRDFAFASEEAVSQVALGSAHSCVLFKSGTVKCWGANNRGQLGDGNTISRRSSDLVYGLSNVVQIAAGSEHSCAIFATGSIKCWGQNLYGQLGDGTTTDRALPVDVVGITGASQIVLGESHSCALLNSGDVECWGNNSYGQLGDGTTTNRPIPVATQSVTSASQLAVGGNHSCALLETNVLECWGKNNFGQLGDGTTIDRSTPVGTAGITSASQVDLGENHSCALLIQGDMLCWGNNSFGQLGDGTKNNRLSPKVVEIYIAKISLGDNHSCSMIDYVLVKCWGKNNYGQVGDATFIDRVFARSSVRNFESLNWNFATGGNHSCTYSEITVMCWGLNNYGQIGDGMNINRPVSVRVEMGHESDVKQLSVGNTESCAVMNSATVKCWGAGTNGIPRDVIGLIDVVQVEVGHNFRCALLKSGEVKCWGNNASGQLGDGTLTDRPTPVTVSGITNATSIGVGNSHSCAVLQTGYVKCWGYNFYSQLGDGTSTNRRTPVEVSGITDAKTLAIGGSHSCVRLTTFAVKCWGNNSSGQLGDGTNEARYSPVGNNFYKVALEAGSSHNCAISSAGVGSVSCWGEGASGQIGDLRLYDAYFPSQVSNLSGATNISLGSGHSCALLISTGIKCWGANNKGQLGDGTQTLRSAPVDVIGITGATQIELGSSISCAQLISTAIRCWGGDIPGNGDVRNSKNIHNVIRLYTSSVPESTYITLSAAAKTAVTFSWFEPFNGYSEISDYIIQYRVAGTLSWSTFIDSVSKETSGTITGLETGTEYEFRVGTVNAVGTSWSNIISNFPNPPEVIVASASSSSVGLSWTVPIDAESAISDYVVEYRVSGALTWLTFNDGVSTGTSTTVTGLLPGVTYEFRVGAANTVGTKYSFEVSASTKPVVPDAPIVTIGSLSSSSVGLSWTIPFDGGSALTDYVVEYRVQDGLTWLTFNDGVSTGASATVSGLSPGVTYEFRVGATNSVGTTYSTAVSATTSAVAPDATVVTVGAVASSSVGLSWTIPFDGGSAITDYVVEYRVQDGLTWLTFNDGVSTGTSATVSGLSPGVTYEFRVGTTNSVGTTYSTAVTATTAPLGFSVSAVTPLSVSRGSAIDVTGTLLSLVSEVRIGSLVVPFRFVSDSLIVVTVPTTATSGNLRLLSTSQDVVAGALTVSTSTVAPTITAVEPYVSVPGAVVTVRGNNVGASSIVRIGSVSVPFSVTGRGSFTITLGANLVNGKVQVTTPGGSVTSTGTLVVPPRITTSTLRAGVGVPVTITGENLVDVTSVLVGGKTATPSSKTSTSVSFTIPTGVVTGSGSVTGPGGVSNSFTFQLLNPPTLNTFTISAKIGDTITLSGTNLMNVTGIKVGSVVATSFSSTDTTVTFVLPTGATNNKVTFSGSAGTVTSSSTLTVLQPPKITSISPKSGKVGTTVTIKGTNLSNATVTFGTKVATKSSNTASEIKVKVPSGLTKGVVTIKVVTANGEATISFTVT